MRVGYFGPAGTFTHEALTSALAGGEEPIPLPTIYDTALAVRDGAVERALVPIENSLEGAVNATLDAIAIELEDVVIVGELVRPISQCVIARDALELEQIEVVVSHPQPAAQCARFLRERLAGAEVRSAASTAEAVRTVAEQGGAWAALGNRLAAELYDCAIVAEGVEDHPENETRFVWLARTGAGPVGGEGAEAWKTSIVFWGAGDEAPGWLVACLSELSERGVNLTKIESRPRKLGLGHYMFFADLDGRDSERRVAEAIAALRERTEGLRLLGSYPAA
jgi:prephenate dehydratase